MYGDTDVLRRHVDQLREQAVDVQALADQLVSRSESLTWSGRAAESMRQRVTERSARLRRAAAQHESAADSLDKHAQEVDGAKETIEAVEQRAHALVGDARTRVARAQQVAAERGLDVLPEAEDAVVAAFTPPPRGHRDWLAVELPGL